MPDDSFEALVERLYAGPTGDFIVQRDRAVKDARDRGDREEAARIKALRRPTLAAALINRFRHGDGAGAFDDLLDLGVRLRAAQSNLDAPAMKSLSAQRNSLIAELVARTADASAEPVSPAAREQLADTFTAAVADADAARAVASGHLVTALRYSGFGEVDLRDSIAVPLSDESAPSEESRDAIRRAAQRELDAARAALTAAEAAEAAATAAAELAERALRSAQQTADKARARMKDTRAVRETAAAAVTTAAAHVTSS